MSLLAEKYKKLDEDSLWVLYIIESNLKNYEYVPVRIIAKKTRFPPKKLDAILGFLNSEKLIRRRVGYEVGYTLTIMGLDMLAINALVKKGVLEALGDKIGVGKESDIYEALTPEGERVALKLHRVGRRSFRRTVILRPYVLERETKDWLSESKLSAQREYRALEELSKLTDYVPKPIGYNRHAVVTSFIDGVELYRVGSLSDPEDVLSKIISVVDTAFNEVGIVHGDLSEYNIIIEYPEEKPSLIDWPQYFYRDHPAAIKMLERDVYYVVRYFNKKYRTKIDWKHVVNTILAKHKQSPSIKGEKMHGAK